VCVQVVREVRDFFACPTLVGALTEDGNSLVGIENGTAGLGHFEHSVYYKEFIQGQARRRRRRCCCRCCCRCCAASCVYYNELLQGQAAVSAAKGMCAFGRATAAYCSYAVPCMAQLLGIAFSAHIAGRRLRGTHHCRRLQVGSSLNSFDLGRMTDLTLGLYQDSGWYDVKYGSSGVSTHGYKAGCAFGYGDAAGVLANASTARLLCQPSLVRACDIDQCVQPLLRYLLASPDNYISCLNKKPPACSRCLGDYSGTALCREDQLDNGFVFPKPVRAPASSAAAASVPRDAARQRPCLAPAGAACSAL
jgi:hypothetical protein